MSKIEPLTPINASYTGITKLNAHLDKIEVALENTLSRDGSTPNAMNADIDMNDNQLINVGEPLLDHNVATKRYVDDLVSGEGTYIIATSALGTGWGNVLAQAKTSEGPISATSYGYLANGLAATAASNKTALQNALDANYWVLLPPGTGYANKLTLTRTNRLSGVGQDETILYRGDSSNDNGIVATSKHNLIFEDFTFNANAANNTGSGSHGGINLTTCNNGVFRNIKLVDWEGLFSGAVVGVGLFLNGGTGANLFRVFAENCYDGLICFQHDNFWTYHNRFTSCTRAGALYNDCDRWVDNDTLAVLCGNDVTLDAACAGVLVQNCKHWVANNPECKDSPYGYGFQIQITCDDWVLTSPRVTSNAWDGVGITGGLSSTTTRGRIVGGYGAANRASNLAVNDASTDVTVVGFVDAGGSLQGINVFRSTAHLIACYGNVTVWDAGVVNTLAIGAAGAGYTNGTYTAVPLVGPTWYTDGLGRSSLTANITVAGGVVTVATINFIGNLATPPASLTGLTAPTLPGGAGALFTITLVGASSNTCQGTTITDGHNGGTLRVQSGAITYLPVKSCGFTTITDPGYTVSNTAIPASLQNSWVVDTRAVYYKDADGIVHVEGRIKDGTVAANTLIFTLPTGFRPAFTERFVIEANGVFGRVYVEPDGEVRDLGGSFSAAGTSLNHIRFRAV